VVSHANACRSDVVPELFEPPIAQFSGSHLDAYMVQLGVGLCIEMGTMKRHLMLTAEFNTELFVPIRFSPAQMKITMCGMNVIALLLQ
jgi:hypothetical protein